MLSLSELNGKLVITSDEFELGELEGGNIDTTAWHLTHIHVRLNDQALKAFSMKKPFMGSVLVCLPVDIVKTVDDNVHLKEPVKNLKDMKQCKEYT